MTIQLFTDFGATDLYVGQVRMALQAAAPGVPVFDLLNDVPAFGVGAGAHLLAALLPRTPAGSVTLAVVDPGVGSARDAVAVVADERWLVGPDNGLLSVVAGRASACVYWRITGRPEGASASFHGRDLFAPIAGAIARGAFPAERLAAAEGLGVRLPPGDLAEVIYIDHYGNLMTGLRAGTVPREARVRTASREIAYARVFSDVPGGTLFWYENSIGLVELAANQASAAALLGLGVGDPVAIAT
jgi:S-adenosylmethionine hydrolase